MVAGLRLACKSACVVIFVFTASADPFIHLNFDSALHALQKDLAAGESSKSLADALLFQIAKNVSDSSPARFTSDDASQESDRNCNRKQPYRTGSLLWSLASTLRQCGVSSLPRSWPTNSELRQEFQDTISDAFDALANIRSDNASLICSRIHSRNVEHHVGDRSAEATEDGEKSMPRCPRCGYIVAADTVMQAKLRNLRNWLRSEAPEVEPSLDSAVPLSDECQNETETTHWSIAYAWSHGGAAAALTISEELPCGICGRAGFYVWFNGLRSAASPEEREVASAALALASVRCAIDAATGDGQNVNRIASDFDVPEWMPVKDAVSALEHAAWTGVGFPLLQELAVRTALRLRGGLSPHVSAALHATQFIETHSCNEFIGNRAMPGQIAWVCDHCVDRFRNPHWATDLGQETDVLDRLASTSRGKNSLDPVGVALYYLQVASAHKSERLVSVFCIARAAIWLYEASRQLGDGGSSDRPGWIVKYAFQDGRDLIAALSGATFVLADAVQFLGGSVLAPSAEHVVLSSLLPIASDASMKSSAPNALLAASVSNRIQSRLSLLLKQVAFKSPPEVQLRSLSAFAVVAERIYMASVQRLRGFASKQGVDSAAALGIYEAALAVADNPDIESLLDLRPAATGAILTKVGKRPANWRCLQFAMAEAINGYAGRMPEQMGHEAFASVHGLRLQPQVGTVELLLRRPRVESFNEQSAHPGGGLLTPVAVAVALTSGRFPFTVTLEPRHDHSDQDVPIWPGRSPLRNALISSAVKIPLKTRFLRSLLKLSSLAPGGGMLSAAIPFPIRLEGRSNPDVALYTVAKSSFAGLRTILPKLELQCKHVSYWARVPTQGPNISDFSFAVPSIDVAALDAASDAGPHLRILASELAQNFRTKYASTTDEISNICSLIAAAKIIRGQTVHPPTRQGDEPRMNNFAEQEEGNLLLDYSQPEQPSKIGWWLEQLAKTHAMVLNSLGFVDLDPGRCWDKDFTFGKCCSVGGYHEECWQTGFTEERCCGGISAADSKTQGIHRAVSHLLAQACEPVSPHVMETVAESVAAWLFNTRGWRADGTTFSGHLSMVLDRDITRCDQQRDADRKDGFDQLIQPRAGSSMLQAPPPDQFIQVGVSVDPVLHPGDGPPPQWDDGVTTLTLKEIADTAAEAQEGTRVIELAKVAPRIRTLSRLASLMRVASSGVSNERVPSGTDNGKHDNSSQTIRSNFAGKWSAVKPVAGTSPGEILRLRRVDKPSDPSQEVDLLGVLALSRTSQPPAALHHVRYERRSVSGITHSSDFIDLASPVWLVEGNRRAPRIEDRGSDNGLAGADVTWPECIFRGETLRGAENAALFANLIGFGVRRGCFRDDCSHSDHFACDSPAFCARTCSGIRACRWWTYWQPYNGIGDGTCWLRSHDRSRAPMINAVAASRDCVPPAGRQPGSNAWHVSHSEPTLFNLAHGVWGVGPTHPLHQWDLVKVLSVFGRLTASQLQEQPESALRRSAARFVKRALRSKIVDIS